MKKRWLHNPEQLLDLSTAHPRFDRFLPSRYPVYAKATPARLNFSTKEAAMGPCLSSEQVQRLLSGQLGQGELLALEEHVQHSPPANENWSACFETRTARAGGVLPAPLKRKTIRQSIVNFWNCSKLRRPMLPRCRRRRQRLPNRLR